MKKTEYYSDDKSVKVILETLEPLHKYYEIKTFKRKNFLGFKYYQQDDIVVVMRGCERYSAESRIQRYLKGETQ